jgi:hypothetical protein
MTIFPWIKPITCEAPYSKGQGNHDHLVDTRAALPRRLCSFVDGQPGTTPGNVKLLLPPRQSRGISQCISNRVRDKFDLNGSAMTLGGISVRI